jgi:hypothetical protein
MVLELAQFTVREADEEQLVADRPAMIAALRKRFPACLAAYLTREEDGRWLDVLLWRSQSEADEATGLIATVPECAAWLAHIAESGGIRHTTVVDAWSTELTAMTS